MVKLEGRPALVLIDVQNGWKELTKLKWSSTSAVQNMAKLLELFRKNGWNIVHVRHDSRKAESVLKEGKPGFEFQEEVAPRNGEDIITKHVNSAFIGTDLEERLRKMGADPVVICGLVTDHCVSTTARMAGNLGFNTVVVEDACAAYSKKGTDGIEIDADVIHRVNLASINGEFARVVKAADLL